MDLFVSGKLSPLAFDDALRRGTHDLSDVLLAAAQTHSAAVEGAHFLMALARVPGGSTQKGLEKWGVGADDWRSGLARCVKKGTGLPPPHLLEGSLDPGAAALLEAARARALKEGRSRISEAVLLLAALAHATPEVRRLCQSADIDLEQWSQDLEQEICPPRPLDVFAPDGAVVTASFSPGGKKVLRLLRTEAEALGYATADPRHLLLGLLAVEGGATQYGLYQQGVPPRTVQEAVLLQLRAKARRTRSSVPADRAHFQVLLQRILEQAGKLAARGGGERRIAERHLLGGLLALGSTARDLLEEQKVDVARLAATAEKYDPGEEADEDEAAVADVETIRQRLRDRLVGQDDAVEQILPYVETMRFGFATPERPVGVFLFCGQSGSGKTEMAKELARAVYGSEENLVFLEMGQFNSPESMNIFVGAPPGYVGFGQGKLTNGLRDKPKAVVLFDEVEKANARVLDALLRFLDEGKIDDPAGPVRDGSQAILILTSNVGADDLSLLATAVEDSPNRRTEVRRALREQFKKHNFRPEFLNRVDEVLLFRTLTRDDYVEIAGRHLKALVERLRKERQIEVVPDPGVAGAVGGYCAEISEGARAVKRLLRAVVVLPVIRFALKQGRQGPLKVKVRAVQPEGEPGAEPVGVAAPA